MSQEIIYKTILKPVVWLGRPGPVSYTHLDVYKRQVLNSSERNYNVTEKELLSVVFSCGKFRTYILGYPITVRTDHKSISFLRNCKLSHGRLTRWSLVLQEYDLNWEYIPGKKNIVADTLSRVNIKEQTYEGEKETVIKIYHIIKNRTDLANIMKEMERQQAQDPKLSKILSRLTDKDDHISQYYCKHQGLSLIHIYC